MTPYELACAALRRSGVSHAHSAIFLHAWQAGHAGRAVSTCPYEGQLRHEWMRAYALGRDYRPEPDLDLFAVNA